MISKEKKKIEKIQKLEKGKKMVQCKTQNI
jgi:hypothetical protein